MMSNKIKSYLCENIDYPNVKPCHSQYCAMVVGLDQAVSRVAAAARASLGPDTLLVLTSDNGGSVFFGGLNAPLRSGKHTSFEVDR